MRARQIEKVEMETLCAERREENMKSHEIASIEYKRVHFYADRNSKADEEYEWQKRG